MIGSLSAYLSRNRRAITGVSNYRYPIWTFCNWIPVILDTRVICTSITRSLMASFRTVSYSFQNLWKALQTFSLKRSSQKTFLILKFVIDTIN